MRNFWTILAAISVSMQAFVAEEQQQGAVCESATDCTDKVQCIRRCSWGDDGGIMKVHVPVCKENSCKCEWVEYTKELDILLWPNEYKCL